MLSKTDIEHVEKIVAKYIVTHKENYHGPKRVSKKWWLVLIVPAGLWVFYCMLTFTIHVVKKDPSLVSRFVIVTAGLSLILGFIMMLYLFFSVFDEG